MTACFCFPQAVNVRTYGAKGDGVTDDTTAIQNAINAIVLANFSIDGKLGAGVLYFPPGVYIVTSLTLPGVDNNHPTPTIEFLGPVPPPAQYFVTFPPPVNGYATIKRVDTSSTSVIRWTGDGNVVINFTNIIFQLPPNPAMIALDLSGAQANRITNVLIHCGNTDLATITQPTHTTQAGIYLPGVGQSPYNYVEGVTVFGCYTGLIAGELTYAVGYRSWGCWQGIVVPFCNHPSHFADIGIYWGPYGIVASGNACPILVDFLDIEHAAGQGQGWQDIVYDLDDVSNKFSGFINWYAVESGSGSAGTFTKHGGTGVTATQL